MFIKKIGIINLSKIAVKSGALLIAFENELQFEYILAGILVEVKNCPNFENLRNTFNLSTPLFMKNTAPFESTQSRVRRLEEKMAEVSWDEIPTGNDSALISLST